MRIGTVVSSILLCAAAGAQAEQQAEPEGARELYYRAMVQKDPPPPARRVAARSGGASAPITPVSTEAMHLGLRYNLVLVDADSGRAQSAAPDRMFRAGECFAIELESNRAGFLYVLAKQSSGSWHPLVPSTDPDMATESNVIVPGKRIRVPLEHCFELQNPREPRDSFELYENIKAPAAPAPNAPRRPAASVQVADAGIADGAVARMREQFGTRDISIKRISQPLGSSEPPESVYVVNSSSSPSSNVAAQIEVRHR